MVLGSGRGIIRGDNITITAAVRQVNIMLVTVGTRTMPEQLHDDKECKISLPSLPIYIHKTCCQQKLLICKD